MVFQPTAAQVCPKGHRYLRRSDNTICPLCESDDGPALDVSRLSAPVRRALQAGGITSLQALAAHTESELLQLHGLGKAALGKLAGLLAEAGRTFRQDDPAREGLPDPVADYIARFPEVVAKRLREMRRIIRKAAPAAIEKISYGMPGYEWNGMLVWFGGNKSHVGLYPKGEGIREFAPELKAYPTSKGAIRFPLDAPLPSDLIMRIVRFRMEQHAAKGKK